ncbi:valine--tRNA ligase [Elusimicrobiota bacterium]
MEISKRYNPEEYEKKWAERWVKTEVFASKPNNKPPFSIVIPPPNVTGVLHMGHALNNVIQDIIIRFNKITGHNTMWMPGTDHGGIATQNVVERQLYEEGKTRHDLGRDDFLKRMWSWKEESGGTIIEQLKCIGCGCDWDRLRFTMDEYCSLAVLEAFKQLFDEGLIYRGKRMTNWCPRCHTALADIEVEHEEKDSHLWHIKYPIVDSEDHVIVATTRPETMLGDTAVAVNPKDERYTYLIGKEVVLPLTGRKIKIVADEFVDMEFGTGCVKVTPAHDPNDNELAKRHGLNSHTVIDKDGKMTNGVNFVNGEVAKEATKYFDKDRFECRKMVIADLQENGLIEKIENYRHAVGTCYRCATVIEPLNTRQWFLKMKDMAARAAEATRDGRVAFHPGNWQKPYLNWLDNIQDWCLSRQIWWGHRIPIWYCTDCNSKKIYIVLNEKFISDRNDIKLDENTENTYQSWKNSGMGHEEIVSNASSIYIVEDAEPLTCPEKCPSCSSTDFIQDPDVLDTWFSSALWPFSTLGWPNDNEDLKYYYPTDVLVTGHEILYLWVARMVMMGLKMMDGIPFKNVNIHGIIRDEKGNKMSKSKGNVINPLDIVAQYGTDSLRFALAKSAVPGRDIQLSDDDFIGARNFCNKIWNASRLILSNLDIKELGRLDTAEMELIDKWIIHELQETGKRVAAMFQEYNNAAASRFIYDFTWKYYCDWYLEIAKIRLYSEDDREKKTVQNILVHVLIKILNMMYPVMPFISSQLWEYIGKEIRLPSKEPLGYNGFKENIVELKKSEVADMVFLMEIVSGIRNIRGEMGVQPAEKLDARIKAEGSSAELIKKHFDYVIKLCSLRNVEVSEDSQRSPGDAVSVVGNVSVFLPMPEDLRIKEIKRIKKRITEVQKVIENSVRKLRNRDFISKAPEAVVTKVRKNEEKACEELKELEHNLTEIKNEAETG